MARLGGSREWLLRFGEIALGSDESGDCSMALLLGRDAALRVREGFGMCELERLGAAEAAGRLLAF